MEDGANALTDKLGRGFDSVFSVFDEDGDFAGAGRFEDTGKLGDGLLEDLGWTDVNFGNHYNNWDIKGEGDTQMFSVFG